MIEIIGERKSGTNYCRRMIGLNFPDERIVVRGWKHRELTEVGEQNYICCIRHPYQWLKSLYQKPYHLEYLHGKPFSQFIRAKIKDRGGAEYKNLVDMWNKKNTRYLTIPEAQRYFLIHENVIKDFEAEFKQIAELFKLEGKGELQNINKHVDDVGVRNYQFREKFYFEISQADREFIRQELDNNLMRKWGFNFR